VWVSGRFAARQLVRITAALAEARGSGRALTLMEARRLCVPALALARVVGVALQSTRPGIDRTR
jgi:hypothetical protein